VRMSFESTSLMLERSERPLANSQEFCHGGHLYAGYRTDDLTLKQAALASGKVDEALFDKVVQPIEMVGVGLGGA
jgi:fumarate hydratase class II